ncbi:MAG: prepilin-type N-terminal cleavage/methylation domain-containing protein [Conexivisphaerales archaeon]
MFLNTKKHKKTAPTRDKGFTLIEVIVAIAIFSMMVVIAISALNQTLTQYHNIEKKGVNFWENARFIWLNNSIADTCDYYVKNDNNLWFPYFIGNLNYFSYVSLSPIANSLPVVVYIVKKQNADGSFSLDYYETRVYTKTYNQLKTIYNFGDYKKNTKIPIITHAKSISFYYYGYDAVLKKNITTQTFMAEDTQNLPSMIKITYTAQDGQHNILYFSVYANSLLKGDYNLLYRK